MTEKLQPVVMEGRRILFRNFAGEPDKFNPSKGKRTFAVVLLPDEAEAMRADGWNVKTLPARTEEDEPLDILRVTVKMDGRNPPRVILVSTKGKTALDEEMIKLLDWADIENVDMIVRPWSWSINGGEGVAAYLKSIYVTIREDELERKYMDVPDIGAGSVIVNEPSTPPWDE
jgi:hypothetical protein